MSITCTQCGESFDPSDVVTIKGFPVCVSCKPLLLKKIQEGDTSFTGFIYKGFWIRGVAEVIDAFLLGIVSQSVDIFIKFSRFDTATSPFSALSIFSLAISIIELYLSAEIKDPVGLCGKLRTIHLVRVEIWFIR